MPYATIEEAWGQIQPFNNSKKFNNLEKSKENMKTNILKKKK